jgi:hypothetical protein
MAQASTLNLARECDALAAWCKDFEIFAHQPVLQAQLRGFDLATEHPFDRVLYESWKEAVLRFQAFHDEYPFVVAPPAALCGEIPTGLVQLADEQPLSLHWDELMRHIGIFGMTGAAKTTIAQTLAANAAGAHLHIIDGKRDAEHFLTRDPSMLTLTPATPLPLLDREHLGGEHTRLLIRTLRRALYGGEGLEQVATEGLALTYERHPRPTLVDLQRVVLGMERKGDTYTRRDRITGLAMRLARIIDAFPGWSTTPAGEGLDLDLLRTRSWYFGFTVHTEIEDFLSTFLIEYLFARKRLLNDRTTRSLVLIDEAVRFFHDQTISGDAALVPTLGLLREFQIGCIITANNVRSLPETLKSNLYLQITLNLTDHAETAEISRTFGLTSAQQEFLNQKLTRGLAIARLADRWRKPILATFPPPTFDKHISAEEWTAAQQRTDSQARRPLAAREGDESTSWQPPAHAPTATASRDQPPRAATSIPASPVSSSAQHSAPDIAHNTLRTTPRPRIALNQHCTAMINDVANYPFTLTTPCFGRCELRLSEGDRALKRLLGLSFVETHRVRTGAGRGKTGNALRLTPAGWAWLGRTPMKGTRGGDSVQHAFCIHELARRLPHSTIETLGVDLVIAYNAEEHEHLNRALETLSDRTIALNTGDLIALEIETSAPRVTGPRNVAKDAGFALTVIATFAQDLPSVQHLGADRVVVIDVLRLMDALRTTEAS